MCLKGVLIANACLSTFVSAEVKSGFAAAGTPASALVEAARLCKSGIVLPYRASGGCFLGQDLYAVPFVNAINNVDQMTSWGTCMLIIYMSPEAPREECASYAQVI